MSRRRSRVRGAAIATIALIVALLQGVASPASAADPQSRWVFDYTGNTQLFSVPSGVTQLTMLVTGGAGANPNSEVGRGGAAGMVLARFAVTPGETLTIWVGQGGVGGGGWGWGCGGDHGHAPDSIGRDGGGGGGASAVTKGAFANGAGCANRPGEGSVYAIGGGGGGGGGDGYEFQPTQQATLLRGGDGGNGGMPAHSGDHGSYLASPPGTAGGCGGCEGGRNGGDGGNALLMFGGGGGGGGGGHTGGGKGAGSTRAAGGGGGGSSYIAQNAEETFFQTGDAAGDGQVVLSLEPVLPFGTCEGAAIQTPTDPAFPLVGFHLEGAQGGQPHEGHGGVGGFGGIVAGETIVPAGVDDIDLYIGCYGQHGSHVGWGWSNGGSHGVANTEAAYTGGTGGGSTAIVIDGAVKGVAGAGGAGGGNADGSAKGGNGGNGGLPAHDGADGGGTGSSGGDGGSGGCQTSGHGGGGGDAESAISGNGGGGGGGGGMRGGCGGASGDGEPLFAGAGGGGGGGTSWIATDVWNPTFDTSKRARDGMILLTFGTVAISSDGGSKQRAELNNDFASPLAARVTDAAGAPLAGLEVEFDLMGEGAGHPSGTFGAWANGVQTERVMTGADGVARSSTVRAGINPGSWTATARLVDYEINDTAHYSLTNLGVPTAVTPQVDPRPALAAAPIDFTAAVATGIGTAHGSVDFWIDGVERYTGTLVDGTATVTYSPATGPGGFILTPGTHTLVVEYGGDEAHAPSSATTDFSVVAAQSVTTLTSSQNPAPEFTEIVYEVVTEVPDGFEPLAGYTVDILIGASGMSVSGVLDQDGRFRTEPIGMTQSSEITAVVSGDGPVAGSSSRMIQYIGEDHAGVAVTSSVNPAAAGQPILLTATLTAPPGGPTPTGGVVFTDGSTVLCSAVADADARASCTAANPSAVGAHRVVATYEGDATYAESYGHLEQHTVPGVTVTSLESAPADPSMFGEPVSFVAHVALADGDTADDEVTGTVTFLVDGEPFGPPVAVATDGTATSDSVATLPVGAHAVTASYGGDAALLPSSAATTHDVVPASSAVTLSASSEPSMLGEPVAFHASVAAVAPGAGTPEGTVQFRIDGVDFGGPVPLAGGVADSPSTSALARGTHQVNAVFTSTSASFTGSEADISHAVTVPAATTTVVTSSANPSAAGQPVDFTATVTGPPGAAPSGSIQFLVDGVPLGGPVTLVGASAASPTTVDLTEGQHVITANYSGSAVDVASSGQLTQWVGVVPTSTTVTASQDPSIAGTPVRFTATIVTAGASPAAVARAALAAALTVSGQVQFTVDGRPLGGPVTLSDGVAQSPFVSDLSVGSHVVLATFTGAGFASSQGELTQLVAAAPPPPAPPGPPHGHGGLPVTGGDILPPLGLAALLLTLGLGLLLAAQRRRRRA